MEAEQIGVGQHGDSDTDEADYQDGNDASERDYEETMIVWLEELGHSFSPIDELMVEGY